MKIGISGTRGIPNRYGGFEQCAEKLALGLVARGHEVWVYSSDKHDYQQPDWKGVQLIHCADPEDKLGTPGQFLYDLACFRDARKRGFDVLLQLGYTSSSVWWWLWPKTCPNLINMDGLEWKRSKFSPKVQRFLKWAEKLAAVHGDLLIADNKGIQQHLQQRFGKSSVFIPYGADGFRTPDAAVLNAYGLQPNGYHLLIARMEPENNIEIILDGYVQSGNPKPFVVVGKTTNAFGKQMVQKFSSHPAIRFTGGIYDFGIIDNLRHFADWYFHGHSVGGTNPSLLEAMGCGALIAAHDNIFNRSVLGEDAVYFKDAESVATILQQHFPESQRQAIRASNLQKIELQYNWEQITNAYETTFQKALDQKKQRVR
ncbi:MAG: glycosyltransferase family 1 protein [Sphingobacteriales bacterium]|nr:MAG: glycosyltransferase family 1 protein [Sphingobacteriales bacterium]